MASDRYAALLCLLVPASALAMTELDDSALAAVNGRDGIALEFESTNGIGAQEIRWETDGGAAATDNRGADTLFRDVVWMGDGGPMQASLILDLGTNQDGVPMVGIVYEWQPGFYGIGAMTLDTDTYDYSDHSLGQLGVWSEGHFNMVNHGVFSTSEDARAQLDFSLYGDLIIRQGDPGTPEFSLGNLTFENRFSTGVNDGHAPGFGVVGIDQDGLLIKADHTWTHLEFDLMYKENPDASGRGFDREERSPILRAGWIGGLDNASFQLMSGGVGYAEDANFYYHDQDRSQGLTFRAGWDFASDFNVQLGHADDTHGTLLRLGDWRRLGDGHPNATGTMFGMDVILDVLQNNHGPGGLCFGSSITGGMPTSSHCTANGGQFYNTRVPAGDAGFALLLRDGHLHGYSNRLSVVNPSSNTESHYDFGLGLTFGQLDADIILYPRGLNGSTEGLKLDTTLMITSPGFWDAAHSDNTAERENASQHWYNNSHLLLANTDENSRVAVGLLNYDMLWQTRDLHLRIGDEDPVFSDMRSGIMLTSDTRAQYFIRGMLGGGHLEDLGPGKTSNVALMQFNLDTNRYRFVLYPESVATEIGGNIVDLASVGFEGFFELNGDAFLTLAEASMPQAAFRLFNVEGSLGWRDGHVVVKSADQHDDGRPSLTIRNQLLLGEDVNFGGGPGNPLVGDLGFGDNHYGRIAMPGGTWHSEIMVRVAQ
ncbi:hypothetical protein K8B33_06245 [Alcanivorax sp. JB21]|uniref:DUF6160 family protein n=1 Tax=Alcanivorax limicola TaxID=2874102 RepID=UPI001CBD7798|nr:DUF6160 family protein [Alcanivorax limicola]MBZ2188687.1 hypothetical protein [Alcanivorax limicola]